MAIRRHRLTRWGFGALLVLAGCGSAENGDPAKAVTFEGAWDAVVTPRVTKQPTFGMVENCTAQPLTLRFEPIGSEWKMISNVSEGALERTDTGYSLVDKPFYLGASGGCLSSAGSLTELSLRVQDTDGDGKADAISGSGAGTGLHITGDTGSYFDLALTLTATPDQTAPSLNLPESPVDPLLGLYFSVSEPLPPTSTVSLQGSSDIDLTAVKADDVDHVLGFHSTRVLPFGGEWSVVTSAQDFAGHALLATTRVTTVEDPGVFPQDGFESEALIGRVSGSSEIVAGIGTLPALAGQHSLLVRSGSTLLHLVRRGNEQTLRVRARALIKSPNGGGAVPSVSAGVVGSDERALGRVDTTAPTVATGDVNYPYASPEAEISLALSGEGPDVVVGIASTAYPGYCPICPSPGALLLDELRLE